MILRFSSTVLKYSKPLVSFLPFPCSVPCFAVVLEVEHIKCSCKFLVNFECEIDLCGTNGIRLSYSNLFISFQNGLKYFLLIYDVARITSTCPELIRKEPRNGSKTSKDLMTSLHLPSLCLIKQGNIFCLSIGNDIIIRSLKI